jgi:RimJ/RimL family protein N-acetyltransferase
MKGTMLPQAESAPDVGDGVTRASNIKRHESMRFFRAPLCDFVASLWVKENHAMLQGERVVLRAVEREDLKRLHELNRNVDLVLLGDGEWQPQPLAAIEKDYDKHVGDDDKAGFVIEVAGSVIGDINLHHRDRRSAVAALGVGIYDPAFLGQGYGREAIGLLLGWAAAVCEWRIRRPGAHGLAARGMADVNAGKSPCSKVTR